MKMRVLCFSILLLTLLLPLSLSARVVSVFSPDNNICVNFEVKNGIPVYHVMFCGEQVIKDSNLGLELASVKGNGEFSNFDNRQVNNQNSL